MAARIIGQALCAFLACTHAQRWRSRRSFARSLSRAGLVALAAAFAGMLSGLYLPDAGLDLVPLVLLLAPAAGKDRGELSDAVLTAAIAVAGYGTLETALTLIFSLTAGTLSRVSLGFLTLAVLSACAVPLVRLFPEEHWQNAFREELTEVPLFRFPLWFVLTTAAVWACACVSPLYLGVSATACVLAAAAFFGGLLLLCLLIAYRRERTELLLEKQYRDEMQTFMSIIRSQRHDYNFHLQTLQGLIRDGNAEARSYLDALVTDSTAMNEILPVEDAAIGALINSFRVLALQKGIELRIHIENDLADLTPSVYETNKVIGNLLQNAIDETERLSDKSYGIELNVIKRGEYCMIRVSNRIGDPAALGSYRAGVSSKKGHEGIGLASIRVLALRYKGAVYSRVDGDIVHFVAKLPFRIRRVKSE